MKLFEVGKTYYCVMTSETRSYTVTKRTKDFLFYVDAETGEQYRRKVRMIAGVETINWFDANDDHK